MKFKDLVEGGNVVGIVKKTNQKTFAQKIPIKEIGRSKFIKKFYDLFMNINKRFKDAYGVPLWKNIKILKDGTVFNGSTSFIMNPEILDKDIIPFKPTSGDIDIMIPREYAVNLWKLLDSLEDEQIISDVVYKGMNKLSVKAIANQMNTVFEVTFDDIVSQSQVDFELAEFEKSDEIKGYLDKKGNVYDDKKKLISNVNDIEIIKNGW